jgi:hypothetical protein
MTWQQKENVWLSGKSQQVTIQFARRFVFL